MTLIADTFAVAKRPLLIPFLASGFPRADLTLPLLHAVADAGADIIELGVPFSDPMADGPAIQRAYKKALAGGMSLDKVLSITAEFRRQNTKVPLVLMGYANSFWRRQRFAEEAAKAGVNGLIVVDLDDIDRPRWQQEMAAADIDLIPLLSPTSTLERQQKIVADATGFVYYITLKGVTGAHHIAVDDVLSQISTLKGKTPIVAGFGVRTKEDAQQLATGSDGVVIGSRLIEIAEENADGGIAEISAFIADIASAISS